MEANFKVIGSNICRLRKLRNITQKELCKELNVSNGYISQIERGTTKININTLYNIAEYLKCSVHDLLPSDIMSEEERGRQVNIHEIKTSSDQIKEYIEGVFENSSKYADFSKISENTFPQITKQQQRVVCYALAAYIAVNENKKDR